MDVAVDNGPHVAPNSTLVPGARLNAPTFTDCFKTELSIIVLVARNASVEELTNTCESGAAISSGPTRIASVGVTEGCAVGAVVGVTLGA